MCYLLKKWTKNFSHTAKTSILSLYTLRDLSKKKHVFSYVIFVKVTKIKTLIYF